MENKITKISLIKECNNDMQYCKYYMVYFRLYNEDHTRYRKGHFIMQIDALDVQDYYEKNTWNMQEWNDYKWNCTYGFLERYNFDNCKDLYTYCNTTIEDWNASISKYYNPYSYD